MCVQFVADKEPASAGAHCCWDPPSPPGTHSDFCSRFRLRASSIVNATIVRKRGHAPHFEQWISSGSIDEMLISGAMVVSGKKLKWKLFRIYHVFQFLSLFKIRVRSVKQ